MASMPTVTMASAGSFSPKMIQQKSVVDVLQEVQKKIQSFGPGPYTTEQAKEIESLKNFYHRLKADHDKAIQEGKIQNVAVRTTNIMTPVTQVLGPGHVATPGTVQMAKIAPATTALPTQLTTVLPAGNITSGGPVVQPAVSSTKTILPQTSLQQVQSRNVVINRANMQQLQMSGEVAQQKGTSSPQAMHLQVTQSVPAGQAVTPGQIAIRSVTQTLPATHAVKTAAATTSDRPAVQVTQGTPQTVTVQRPLMQSSKSPVNMPITLAPAGTVSAAVPSGGHVVTNIAPAPVAAATSKGLHSTAQAAGAPLRRDNSSPAPNQVLSKRRLQDLLREIDPREQMDDDVEDLLLQIADDFIESVVTASCQIAKHRKSNTLEVRDVQLHLERCWNMWIPGFGSDELRPFKKQATTEAHKQRMALIRKSMKK